MAKNGGPAFPHEPWQQISCGGMSLRDWFAGQVLPTCFQMVVKEYDGILTDEYQFWVRASKEAYGLADVMLAEREKAK